MPIPGIAALSLFASSIIAIIGYFFAHNKKLKPKMSFYGIGIRFLDGADESQSGIQEACYTIYNCIKSEYGAAQKDNSTEMLNLIIEIYGKDAVITSDTIPTGKIFHQDGTPATLMGTCDSEKATPFSKPVNVVKVRQIWDTDASGKVTLRGLGTTALFHEVCEHIIPGVLTGDGNAGHDPKWLPLEQKMDKAYKDLVK